MPSLSDLQMEAVQASSREAICHGGVLDDGYCHFADWRRALLCKASSKACLVRVFCMMAAILLFGGGVRVATTRSPGRIRSLSVNLGASHRTLELVEAGTPGQWGRLKDKAGKCLDFGGERVHLWECQEENKNQLWRYDDATHHIIAHQRSPDTITSKCLDTGTEIRIADCMDGSDVQAWTLNDNGSISVHKAGEVAMCLDTKDFWPRAWPCDEASQYQKWSSERVVQATRPPPLLPSTTPKQLPTSAPPPPTLTSTHRPVSSTPPPLKRAPTPAPAPTPTSTRKPVSLPSPPPKPLPAPAPAPTSTPVRTSAALPSTASKEGLPSTSTLARKSVGSTAGPLRSQSREFLVFGLVIGLCLVSLACMVVGFWSWRSSREDHLEGYNTVNTEDMALLKQQVEATETTVNAARLDQDLLQQQLAEEMDELTIQMKETQESLARGWSAGDAIADEDLDMEWERIREEMCTEECRQNSVRLPSVEHGHAEALNNKLPRSQSSWFDSALVSLTQMSADIRLAAKPTVTLPALASSKAEIEAQIRELQRRMAQAEADAREAAKSSRTDPRAKAHALQCLRQRGQYKLLQERLQSVHCQILQAETLQARVGKQP